MNASSAVLVLTLVLVQLFQRAMANMLSTLMFVQTAALVLKFVL